MTGPFVRQTLPSDVEPHWCVEGENMVIWYKQHKHAQENQAARHFGRPA